MTTKQESRARADWQRRCRANDRSQTMSARYSWEHCPAYSLYKPQPVAAYIAARRLFMASQGVYMPVTLPPAARLPR